MVYLYFSLYSKRIVTGRVDVLKTFYLIIVLELFSLSCDLTWHQMKEVILLVTSEKNFWNWQRCFIYLDEVLQKACIPNKKSWVNLDPEVIGYIFHLSTRSHKGSRHLILKSLVAQLSRSTVEFRHFQFCIIIHFLRNFFGGIKVYLFYKNFTSSKIFSNILHNRKKMCGCMYYWETDF